MALYAFYTNSSNTPELYISTSCQPLRARSSNGCTHKTEGQCLHLACLRVKKLIPRPYITRTCSYNNKKGASTPETKDALGPLPQETQPRLLARQSKPVTFFTRGAYHSPLFHVDHLRIPALGSTLFTQKKKKMVQLHELVVYSKRNVRNCRSRRFDYDRSIEQPLGGCRRRQN